MTTTRTSTAAKPKAGSRVTRQTAREQTRPADAIKVLKQDHKLVNDLFKLFEKTDDDARKQEIADQICMELTVHAQIEEEIFYPAAYAALDDDDMLDEAEVEHASAKALIAEIQASRVGEPLFDARVTVLGEYIRHHVAEEEGELFPECRSSKMELKALGEQLSARKAELMARPV